MERAEWFGGFLFINIMQVDLSKAQSQLELSLALFIGVSDNGFPKDVKQAEAEVVPSSSLVEIEVEVEVEVGVEFLGWGRG